MKNIKLADYTYQLPVDRIASYGLKDRDQSKLLKFEDGLLSHHTFTQITGLLPANSTLFFNNTKVIQARLILKRNTGAVIEVFLLSPSDPQLSIYETMTFKSKVSYTCMIGNLKKWQEGEDLLQKINIGDKNIDLSVCLISKAKKEVALSWNSNDITFAEVLEAVGHTPLPPYIKRPDEKADKERYQTVYSKTPGAVAAPTAGMHFTKSVLDSIKKRGINCEYLTLHVSAGTFQPIKEELVTDHPMHSEQIIITKNNLQGLLANRYIIAVGTTALRTLESTYWFGVQLLLTSRTNFRIDKLAPYKFQPQELPPAKLAIERVLKFMDDNNLETIKGDTEIFIMPGYEFKICSGLITNFHQPGSTHI